MLLHIRIVFGIALIGLDTVLFEVNMLGGGFYGR